MGAALVLEDGEGALALDREGDLLESADVGGGLREHLGREAPPLGVAGEHLVEVAGEQRRLVAAGTRPDLDDHVLLVVGIALDHRQPDLLAEPLQLGGGLGHDLLSSGSSPSSASSSRAPSRSSLELPVSDGQLVCLLRARGTRARPRRIAPGRRSPRDRTSAAPARRSGSSICSTSCSITTAHEGVRGRQPTRRSRSPAPAWPARGPRPRAPPRASRSRPRAGPGRARAWSGSGASGRATSGRGPSACCGSCRPT